MGVLSVPFVSSQGAHFPGLCALAQTLTVDRQGTHYLAIMTICGSVSPGVGEEEVSRH